MRKRMHISTSIDGLLNMKDSELKELLHFVKDDTGSIPTFEAFKAYLEDEKAQGHKYLRAPECDHFDPVHGCLGHPVTEYVPSEEENAEA